MSDVDALSKFDFSKVTGSGLYLKFKANEPVVLRVLTTDPIVHSVEYRNKETDEVESLSTKFAFVVYNFTAARAQILDATATMAKKIGDLHTDPDFGANIRKIDIKISPTGEKLERRYDILVLPKANELTSEMIKEAQQIDLDKEVEGDRMSFYEPSTGYEKARATAAAIRGEDTVVDDIGDEPINLNDIPF